MPDLEKMRRVAAKLGVPEDELNRILNDPELEKKFEQFMKAEDELLPLLELAKLLTDGALIQTLRKDDVLRSALSVIYQETGWKANDPEALRKIHVTVWHGIIAAFARAAMLKEQEELE